MDLALTELGVWEGKMKKLSIKVQIIGDLIMMLAFIYPIYLFNDSNFAKTLSISIIYLIATVSLICAINESEIREYTKLKGYSVPKIQFWKIDIIIAALINITLLAVHVFAQNFEVKDWAIVLLIMFWALVLFVLIPIYTVTKVIKHIAGKPETRYDESL
jgi:hypothetical protein